MRLRRMYLYNLCTQTGGVSALSRSRAIAVAPNKQLQRTVTRRRGRGACAPLHYAHAPRWTLGRAAAELRR